MTRRILAIRGLVTSLLVILLPAAGRAQTTIYPATGTGGNYLLVVVSDGYAANEEFKFDRAVNTLVLNGLMADPFYGAPGSPFTIKKIFKPVPTSGQSAFGITPNYDIRRCYIDYDPTATTTAIDAALGGLAPERTIVIGNHEGVALACTVGTWTYVSAGVREVGGVLEHELGHLVLNLADEFVLEQAPYPGPDVDGPNCSTTLTQSAPQPPSWMALPLRAASAPTNPSGCAYFASKIVRPYPTCRMRAPDTAFCAVCAHEMDGALDPYKVAPLTRHDRPAFRLVTAAYVEQPPSGRGGSAPPAGRGGAPVAPAVERSVRLVVELASGAAPATTKILTIRDVSAPIVDRHRRTGDIAYAFFENGAITESGVVPGDPFQSRMYGAGSVPHERRDVRVASVAIVIPRTSREELKTRPLEIRFYRLKPQLGQTKGGREDVTPDRLNAYIQADQTGPPIARLTANDLQQAATHLP
jgi:hypothetical protein